jgi:MBG domain (YGX type)/Bacterial Ig-like domain (group 3)/FG-GAP-like repeat
MVRRFRFPAHWAMVMGSILLSCQPGLAASSTTTTLAVSPTSTTAGSIITFTATVTSGGVPLTAGQVKFCNASAAYCDNGALLGSVWVTSSGTATLRRAMRVGTTNANAVFQPNNSYSKSTSSTAAVTVTGVDPDTSPLTFLSGGSNAHAIYAGDFNNDGYVDLAVADAVLGTLQIFLGSSSGTFTKGVSLSTEVGSYWDSNHWLVADLNRDGKLDLLDGFSGLVYLGNGDGTFGPVATIPSTPCSGSDAHFTSALADINGDGKPDIVLSCDLSNNIYTLIGSGTGTFVAGPSSNTGSPGPCGSFVPGIGGFALADFNGDGKPDIFVAGYQATANACTAQGTGSGTFTMMGPTFTDAPAFGPIAVGDFRNVGYPDVIFGSGGNYGLLLNNGADISSFGTAVSYTAAPSLIADFNGDGNLDYADIGATAAYGLAGNGTGTFGAAKSVPVSPVPPSGFGTTGDFYNNGIPAVAITTGLSPSYVEIFPLLKTTPPVAVTCAPSAGTYGSSATSCTAQTTAGTTGLMSISYNGTAWGSGDVNGSGAFSVSGLGASPAGSYTITATYAGDENFNSASGSVNYTIDQFTPTITWATPAAITYGTPLSATQLNATASVPGTFAYTPAAGTVLGAGSQMLSVTFTPTDTTDYSTASATVSLTVNKASLTVTANNASRVYGAANPAFTPTYSGFVNGDTSAVLTGSPSLTTTATAASPVDSYTITAAAGSLSAANYSFAFVNGTLTITKATSILSVSSSLNPSVFGNSVTFTLSVGGSGSGVVPTGTVTLTEGGTTLLPATALNGSGQATYTTSTLPAGVNTLTLTYSGDTNYF